MQVDVRIQPPGRPRRHAQGFVRNIRPLRKIVIRRAVEKIGLRPRPAGILPLRLSRQSKSHPSLSRQPPAEIHCPPPRYANNRVLRAVKRQARTVRPLKSLCEKPRIVIRIESPVLLVRHLARPHPEISLDPNVRHAGRIRRSIPLAHPEPPGQNAHKLDLHARRHIDNLVRYTLVAESNRCYRQMPPGLYVAGPVVGIHQQCRTFRVRRTRLLCMSNCGHRLRIFFRTAVLPRQFTPPFSCPFRYRPDVAPRPVTWSVQIDPRNQPIPCFSVQANALVAFEHHLYEFARVGVILARHQQFHIVLNVHPANVWDQRLISRRVLDLGSTPGLLHRRMQPCSAEPGELSALVIRKEPLRPQVGYPAFVLARPPVVTTNTVLIEHRLNLALEIESARRSVPLLNLLGLLQCRRPLIHQRHVARMLVTSHAGNRLAGHGRKPAPHKLHRLALCIQRLQTQRHFGRHLEHGRTVLRHLDRSDDAHRLPRAAGSDLVRTRHSRISVVIGENPQLLDGTPRHARQPRSGVHIMQIHNRIVARHIHPVRNHRRLRAFLQRNRLEEILLLIDKNRQHIVKNVHQIDTPWRLGVHLSRNQKVLVAQRIRVQKLRPPFVNQPIRNLRFDGFIPSGNHLHDAVRFMPAPGQVDQCQPAHPRYAVVTRQYRNQFVRRTRNAARKIKRIGPVRVAAVYRPLACPVRIHYHQRTQIDVHRSAVIPPAEYNLTARQHRWMQIQILIETQLTHGPAVLIHDVHGARPLLPMPAWHRMIRSRRRKHDPPVRKIASVEVIHVLVFIPRYLAQSLAVDADLVYLPRPVLRHRKKQRIRIPVQIHLADELAPFGPVQCPHPSTLLDERQNRQFVVVPRPLNTRIALVIHGQTQLPAFAFKYNQFVEVQQRIGQHSPPL